MALAPGSRLGPYEILAPLGAGGMGEVYRARDPRLGRDVAIKVIPAALSDDPERLARFEQEARAAGSLNHSGVCAIYDVGTHDGAPFVVMELLEGETLRDRLRRGPLPWRKVAELGVGVARALSAAHEKGVVHRDLKPENLFLTRAGGIKVLDFGLAKLVHPEGVEMSGLDTLSKALTGDAIVGTAGYMAPEQVQGRSADARTDLFALGTVLFEMLCGRRAFAGGSFVETGHAILNDEPTLDSQAGTEIPPPLRRLVARCMEKSPEQRFQSASDLAFHLETLLGADSGAAAAPAPARRRLRGGRSVGLALGLFAAAAVLGWIARGVTAKPAAEPAHFAVLPPEGGRFRFHLEETTPFAISPDGRTLAFVATDSTGATRAWLRPLARIEPSPVPGSEGALSVFWSPDGRSLGLTTRGAVKRFDLGATDVLLVCRTPGPAPTSGSWGPQGTILFASSQDGILFAVAARGGAPRALRKPDRARGELGFMWPAFIPGDRRFLCLSRMLDHDFTVMISDLEGHARPLMTTTSRVKMPDAHTLLYVREGTLVSQAVDLGAARVTGAPVPIAGHVSHFATSAGALFDASPAGAIAYQRAMDRCGLAWFDDRGEETGHAGAPADYLDGLALTEDGSTLLCTRRRSETGNWDLWSLDMRRGSESRLSNATNITEAYPLWIPGAAHYVFSKNVGGELPSLQWADASNGSFRELLPATGFQIAQDVTPDGRTLIYIERRPAASPRLWSMALPSGEPRPLAAAGASVGEARLSPDGRWIAWIADEGSGYELSVAGFPSFTSRVRVSAGGALAVRWSRDGRRLFYLTPDDHMKVVEIRGAPSLQVGQPQNLFRLGVHAWKDFLVDGRGRFLALVPEVVRDEEPFDVMVGWRPGSPMP